MDIKEIVRQLTLEEKIALCSGSDFWHMQGIERLGIPALMVTDGPYGLRKQTGQADHLGLNDSVEAVCFPTASAAACSFDREMMRKMGALLGNECQAEDVAVLLGPAVNMKRTPLCGRNFEYYSEDPYLAGEIASAYIAGVQSQNVGTSIKHFAANNQESARMTVSAEIDERTLREIYLPAFETAVKTAKPWTVMCAYNKLNGTYASEHRGLLTEILREEWGYDGFVMSDWGAVHDRVKGLAAGLDLEMPSSNGANDAALLAAVESGALSEGVLDQTAERILSVVLRYTENRNINAVFDREADHTKAVEMAEECIVLLKNGPFTGRASGSANSGASRSSGGSGGSDCSGDLGSSDDSANLGNFNRSIVRTGSGDLGDSAGPGGSCSSSNPGGSGDLDASGGSVGAVKSVLPLDPQEKVVFIGGFAAQPRYQGGGSSHVHAHRVESPLSLAKAYGNIEYAEGFSADADEPDDALMAEALALAAGADKVVVFAGLPDAVESESYDRKNMSLPGCQDILIERLCSLPVPVIVVLSNGSPVEMPWEEKVSAIMESYLCGEAAGEAQMDILYGRANPSGKLAETFPVRLQDNPSYVNYPGTNRQVNYGEGIFIGYRYYDAKDMDVLFPFGHGLSYTTFAYSDLQIEKADETGRKGIRVTLNVANTGSVKGREIVQLYVSDCTDSTGRPPQELKGFETVTLAPGETKPVSFVLDERAFSWYDTLHHMWYAADGLYKIRIGKSSRQIELTGTVELTGAPERPPVFDDDLTIGELLEYAPTRDYILNLLVQVGYLAPGQTLDDVDEMTRNVTNAVPLGCLKSYTPLTDEQIQQMVQALQALAAQEEPVLAAS